MVRRLLVNLALSVGALACALLGVECYARVDGVGDDLLLEMSCSLVDDPAVYRRSRDVRLVFENRPESGRTMQSHYPEQPGWPTEQRTLSVAIDRHGARGNQHPLQKAPGTTRILMHGGSTVWGASLADDETLAAALERSLNEGAPEGRAVEVWNFGASASVMGHSAWQAASHLQDLDPDVLLVVVTNRGPRCDLWTDRWPLGDRIREDPWAAVEYLDPPAFLGPPAPLGQPTSGEPHQASTWSDPERLDPAMPLLHRLFYGAVARSSGLRWAAAVHTMRLFEANPDHQRAYADIASLVLARAALARAESAGVPLVFVSGPGAVRHALIQALAPPLEASIGTGESGLVSELHPPAWIMEWHAARLARQLTAAGLVPGSVPAPGEPQPPPGVRPGLGRGER